MTPEYVEFQYDDGESIQTAYKCTTCGRYATYGSSYISHSDKCDLLKRLTIAEAHNATLTERIAVIQGAIDANVEVKALRWHLGKTEAHVAKLTAANRILTEALEHIKHLLIGGHFPLAEIDHALAQAHEVMNENRNTEQS